MISPRFAAAAMLLLMACARCWAGDSPPPRTFTVECRMVTLPVKAAILLIPELSDDRKVAGAWQRLQGMVQAGQATLEAALFTRGTVGEHVRAESVREIRYATEFQPPQLPETSPDKPLSVEELKAWPHVGIVPTAFETRNVGQTLDVELKATTDPKAVLCEFSAEHVRLEKFVAIDAGRLATGERLSVEQPYFSNLKDSSHTLLESGEPRLIGVHVLPGNETQLELFVFTVTLAAPPTP